MYTINRELRQARIFAWLFLFSVISFSRVSAQNYFFDNYGTRQGLSEQKVYALLQDSRDNIWLGTANGLSRFDGKNFRKFSARDSIAPGGVRCMMEDSLGNIWFGHLNGGLTRFNGSYFEKISFDSLTIGSDISSISQISGAIWFTTYGDGVIRADFPVPDISRIPAKQFKGKDGVSDVMVGSAVIGDTAYVCIFDNGALRRYYEQGKKFENFRMPHYTLYFATTCVFQDSRRNIWFGTHNGGIYKYEMSSSRMQFIDLPKAGVPSNWVTCFEEDKLGRVWVGTWGGGMAYVRDSTVSKFNAGNGFKPTHIYSIMEDVEGNILIADRDNGLTIFKGDAFITFNEEALLPDPNVNAVINDEDGNIWLGTNTGITRFNPDKVEKPKYFNKETGLLIDDIRHIKKDRDGDLWFGTSNGVMMYNMKTSRFEAQPYMDSGFPGNDRQVTALETDLENNIWIGTMEGIMACTKNTENLSRTISLDSVTVNIITAIYCDPRGKIWIGSEPSEDKPTLFRFDPATKQFSKVASFYGTKPLSMVMDRNDVLWVGTASGVRAVKDDAIIAEITQENGLLSDVVNLMAAGDDGSIYFGTNNGLNRYFPETRRIFSYTDRNGFPGIETKPNAVCRTKNGDFWFGTVNGVTRFTPSLASVEETEPLTHILGMRVNFRTREMIPDMKLNYGERTIFFDYNSICITNPDVVRYQVMLQGADTDWHPVTTETSKSYTGLSSGHYTFMVRARNNQGVWNSEPVTFSFTIMPPFYRTWWFILLVVIIILISIIAYIKIREKSLVREKMVLEEKVKERTAEVVQKSMEIEEKNRDITASIRYAERIQRAMLPPVDIFSDTFVLFMPKDIVSGDFYWMHNDTDYQYIAVCDCTGHGVPGAFMSIIGHNSLNKVVREYGITKPSSILDHLNTEVLKALMQRNEETINDGMDMALIAFNRKKFTLEFAGAYNPLYLVRNGEVITYKGDRFPIGMTAISEKKSFSNQQIDIQPGDMLYMCSDGYADQFGTEDVKKYKSGNVKKLLGEIWSLPVEEQKIKLEQETLNWRGNLPQVDDILFIGTKIPPN